MLKSKASSNATDQRNITRLRVLEQIRATEAISRIDIATALETSPATVTSATADLLSAGLIQEIEGESPSKSARRGRPRVLLKLQGGCHVIAGVKVARHQISVILVDFEGTEIASYIHPLDEARMAPEGFTQMIYTALSHACDAAHRSLTDLSGVCIGIAGLIDAEKNFVHWSSSLTERNVDLSPLLSKALPCPAFIENDANLVAKAEQLFGLGKGLKTFLVVTIEHGIGLGIVFDGKLYRGERGCGAEFGHLKVQLDGALCQCGQRGCLEAYVGEYALIREATIASQATDPRTLADILEAAKAGDARSISVLARAGQMFGMGLSNLINLFDPECIILSGTRGSFEYLHSEEVMARVKSGVVSVDAPLPEIKVNHWGDSMWAKGAAAYGIEQVSILKVRELAAHAN
ncbi:MULTISPECIES: ROK family transcriptional regulator [unclassified Ruegeria]|uniref:ROK family transcriptional regulator n=1 Tax=unclassified Ruegeria TaxID=2625375 RepID=UPI0014883DBB|nr:MULTISPECIES: ROK family transcriptional regulator [unclassified Ruegeria]NOD63791.1 ROK family protein [Ruegeria sp. HKCCD6109]